MGRVSRQLSNFVEHTSKYVKMNFISNLIKRTIRHVLLLFYKNGRLSKLLIMSCFLLLGFNLSFSFSFRRAFLMFNEFFYSVNPINPAIFISEAEEERIPSNLFMHLSALDGLFSSINFSNISKYIEASSFFS